MKNSTRTRKIYSQKCKHEAAGLVQDQGYTKAEAARSLGGRPELIRYWHPEFSALDTDAFPGNGNLTPNQLRFGDLGAENRRLKI